MDAIEQLKQFSKALNEYATDIKSGKYVTDVAKECVNAIADDIETIFETAVDDYYDSYSPKYYKRTESLYDVYKVSISGTCILWKDPYMYPGGHRVSGQYIYEKMFTEGYHGGASSSDKLDAAGNPHPGGMVYRFPPPSPGNHAYQYWGRQAVQSTPPEVMANFGLSRYQHNGSNVSGHTLIERVREAFEYVNTRYTIFDLV